MKHLKQKFNVGDRIFLSRPQAYGLDQYAKAGQRVTVDECYNDMYRVSFTDEIGVMVLYVEESHLSRTKPRLSS